MPLFFQRRFGRDPVMLLAVKVRQDVQGRHTDLGSLCFYPLRGYWTTPSGPEVSLKREITTHTTVLNGLYRYHTFCTLRRWCSQSRLLGKGRYPSSGLGALIYFQVGGYRWSFHSGPRPTA